MNTSFSQQLLKLNFPEVIQRATAESFHIIRSVSTTAVKMTLFARFFSKEQKTNHKHLRSKKTLGYIVFQTEGNEVKISRLPSETITIALCFSL